MSFFKKIKIEEKKPHPSPANKKEEGWLKTDGQLAVDIYETDSNFTVTAAIAGVLVKDIDILIEKDMLVIRGSRQNPSKDGEKKYLCQECYWGPFSRKILLPEGLDFSNIEAEMEKGLLTIRIPKIRFEKNKKITLK